MGYPLDRVIILPSDSPPFLATSECSDEIKTIQSYHKNYKNYSDIAYNFIVCDDGTVFEGRGWEVQGAHSVGQFYDFYLYTTIS